jgi:hypothetical protein
LACRTSLHPVTSFYFKDQYFSLRTRIWRADRETDGAKVKEIGRLYVLLSGTSEFDYRITAITFYLIKEFFLQWTILLLGTFIKKIQRLHVPIRIYKHPKLCSTRTNVAAMQYLRGSVQKIHSLQILYQSFLRTGHVLFRVSTVVHYSECFVIIIILIICIVHTRRAWY